MDRGTCCATVHGVTESDMTEATKQACFSPVDLSFQFHVQSARGLRKIVPPAPHTLHMKCDLLGPLNSQEGGCWTIQLFPPPVLLLIDTINIM